jgi:hypothetical protein
MANRILLFARQSLSALLQAHESKLRQDLDKLDPNRLLNSSVDDLVAYFEQEYTVHAPELRENETAADYTETRVDVSQDFNRAIFNRSEPFYVQGTTVTYFVPYDGDQQLFTYQPSTFTFSPPHARVLPTELQLDYVFTGHDADAVRSAFQRDIGEIKRYLQWVTRDGSSFNNSLKSKLREHIEARRAKLLKDQGLAASLGVPLRRRQDAPKTYSIPATRRKLPVPTVRASTARLSQSQLCRWMNTSISYR